MQLIFLREDLANSRDNNTDDIVGYLNNSNVRSNSLQSLRYKTQIFPKLSRAPEGFELNILTDTSYITHYLTNGITCYITCYSSGV